MYDTKSDCIISYLRLNLRAWNVSMLTMARTLHGPTKKWRKKVKRAFLKLNFQKGLSVRTHLNSKRLADQWAPVCQCIQRFQNITRQSGIVKRKCGHQPWSREDEEGGVSWVWGLSYRTRNKRTCLMALFMARAVLQALPFAENPIKQGTPESPPVCPRIHGPDLVCEQDSIRLPRAWMTTSFVFRQQLVRCLRAIG